MVISLEIVKAYQKLGIGDLTIEQLGSLEYGMEDIIRQKYYSMIEQNLDNLGVRIQSLRDLQMQGCEQMWTDFMSILTLRRSLLQRTRLSYQGLNIPIECHHFSVVDGELQFTSEDRERIRECFEIRLNTTVKKDFVTAVDSFIEQYRQIKETLIKNKCGIWGKGGAFAVQNDEVIFEKQTINLIKL